jgi:TPR repeat protein
MTQSEFPYKGILPINHTKELRSLRACFIIITLPLAPLANIPAALAETPAEIAAITNTTERGNQGARSLLGLIYREGHGVPRDARKAFYWIDRSAHARQPYSQFVV